MFPSRHPEIAPAQSKAAGGGTNKGRMHIGGRERQLIRAMHEDAAALGVLPPRLRTQSHRTHRTNDCDDSKAARERQSLRRRERRRLLQRTQLSPYGQLSGKNPDDLRAGERIEIDSHKRTPPRLRHRRQPQPRSHRSTHRPTQPRPSRKELGRIRPHPRPSSRRRHHPPRQRRQDRLDPQLIPQIPKKQFRLPYSQPNRQPDSFAPFDKN